MNIIVEIWKDIKDYEGLYQVSNRGRVRSLDRMVKGKGGGSQRKGGKILKPSTYDGYNCYLLSKGGVGKWWKSHRLVAIHFIPNPKNLPVVRHKNHIRTDCNHLNLEWGTVKDNSEDTVRADRQAKGEVHGRSKLKNSDIPVIWERLRSGESQESISKDYLVSRSAIRAIKGGKNLSHITSKLKPL